MEAEAMQQNKNILTSLAAVIHKMNVMRSAISKRLCTPGFVEGCNEEQIQIFYCRVQLKWQKIYRPLCLEAEQCKTLNAFICHQTQRPQLIAQTQHGRS